MSIIFWLGLDKFKLIGESFGDERWDIDNAQVI